MTLFAKWERITYTVTFIGCDGQIPPQTVEHGGHVIRPDPDPVKEGYVFLWYDFEGSIMPFDFDLHTVFEDIELEARFEPGRYTVYYEVNGGPNGAPPDNETVQYRSKVTRPDLTESDGYRLLGWFKEPECTNEWNFDTDLMGGADMTLFAKWERITYTVSFGGCDGQIPPQTVEHGGHATRPDPDPVMEGHVFIDWYETTSYGTPLDFDTYTVLGNVELEAKFEVGSYTVTFDLNGGPNTATPPDGQTVIYRYMVSRPSLTEPDGYRLLGWFKEPECINEWNFDTDTMGGADIILYAKWQQVKFKITFDPNGLAWDGDTTPVTLTTDESGRLDTSAIPADPTDSEGRKIFTGWFLDLDFSEVDPVNYQFTADVTLKANWYAVA